jgi:hypothetical protein
MDSDRDATFRYAWSVCSYNVYKLNLVVVVCLICPDRDRSKLEIDVRDLVVFCVWLWRHRASFCLIAPLEMKHEVFTL